MITIVSKAIDYAHIRTDEIASATVPLFLTNNAYLDAVRALCDSDGVSENQRENECCFHCKYLVGI